MHNGLDTDTHVMFYENEFYPLSNFSAFRLRWGDLDFDTSEAAYHWEKYALTVGLPERDLAIRGAIRHLIRGARSAHEAFKIAESNKLHQRTDWNVVRVDIMRDILRAKAQQHEYVRRKLLQTGDRELVEERHTLKRGVERCMVHTYSTGWTE